MLTTCPKCSHTYNPHHQLAPMPNLNLDTGSTRCCSRPVPTLSATPQYVNLPPVVTTHTYVNQAPPTFPPVGSAASTGIQTSSCVTSGGISVSLHLPPSGSTTVSIVTTPHEQAQSMTLTAFTNPDHRVLAGMAGGGIISGNNIILQDSFNMDDNHIKFSQPQPSPSMPLSFVLPTPPPMFTIPWGHWELPQQSEADLSQIAATTESLRTSGWYYEGLSWQESADILRDTAPGTFLVRDSSDPRYIFSLSVQTERGPTSVRLQYIGGYFRLDAERRLAPMLPMFDCVLRLVEFYIRATKECGYTKQASLKKGQVWIDARGHMYSHILLTNPLYKTTRLPSLQHLARLAINNQMMKRSEQGIEYLPLPNKLKAYLAQYPHIH